LKLQDEIKDPFSIGEENTVVKFAVALQSLGRQDGSLFTMAGYFVLEHSKAVLQGSLFSQ